MQQEELPDYQYDENEGEEQKQPDGAAKYVNHPRAFALAARLMMLNSLLSLGL